MQGVTGDHLKRRVLVVDDDVQLAKGLQLALDRAGYDVCVVADGAEVPRCIKESAPDLVILDVMMPQVDGWQVLTWLRNEPRTTAIPVIMLTATAAESAKLKGFGLGADDYVTKPFSVRELLARADAVLRRAEHVVEEAADETVPVLSGTGGHLLLKASDVFYAEGIRNYTYVHTFDGRYLSQLSLGSLDERGLRDMWRVHRSFVVNMQHVVGAGWRGHSSYRLQLADKSGTEIPVSRALIRDAQKRLGIKS